jgi:hypothetical protein
MGSELIDREIVINAGGVRIASRDPITGGRQPMLRVAVRIEKTLQKDPNTAEVTIWNLSQDTRTRLQEKGILTEIEAGYFGDTSVIFTGDLDYGSTTRQGADWVTTFQSSDGGRSYRNSRINLSFDAGTALKDVLKTAAESIGVGLGNVVEQLEQGAPRSTATEYVKGLVMSGPAAQQFDKIVKRGGWNWGIQDGQLQLTRPGQAINPAEAIVLRQGTGLIGSPERGEKGIVRATSLLQPELQPGKKVQILAGENRVTGAFEIDGFFRIEKLKITADTAAQEWYSEIEARPL